MATITFHDITPPPRDTGVAWVAVNLYFSDTEDGPYAAFDQLPLSPLDVDPESPMVRTLSTAKSPANSGWFELEFIDNASDSEKLAPIFIEAEPVSQIASLVRSYLPESYKALAAADHYGQEMLDLRIEAARYEVLPLALANADESAYSVLLKDYIACVAALQIIPAAIDHWMRQKASLSAGAQENLTLPDPIEALKSLQKQLLARIAALQANPAIVAMVTPPPSDVPEIDTAGDFVTLDPFEWPPAFQSSSTQSEV